MLLHFLLPVLCVIKTTELQMYVYVVNCNNLRIVMYNFG